MMEPQRGQEPSDEPDLPQERGDEWLRSIASQLRSGNEPYKSSARELLRRFGYKKRGRWVLEQLGTSLAAQGLTVHPAMDAVSLDDEIVIDLEERGTRLEFAAVVSAEVGSGASRGDGCAAFDSLRIGALPTARRGIEWVRPDENLGDALARMVLNDFSQIPVMKDHRQPVGVFSWRSLGRAVVSRTRVSKDAAVQEFMFDRFELCQATAPLLDVLPRIIEHEFVLIQDEQRRISGIVTTTDLADVLRDKFTAFALLAEIEGLLRAILNGAFSLQELCAAKHPGDAKREVESADDLTFGEYRTLLQKPEHWDRLKVRLDRKVFLEKMACVNRIRNDVMHFAVDNVEEDDVKELWQFLGGLRFLTKQG